MLWLSVPSPNKYLINNAHQTFPTGKGVLEKPQSISGVPLQTHSRFSIPYRLSSDHFLVLILPEAFMSDCWCVSLNTRRVLIHNLCSSVPPNNISECYGSCTLSSVFLLKGYLCWATPDLLHSRRLWVFWQYLYYLQRCWVGSQVHISIQRRICSARKYLVRWSISS